MNKMPLKFTKMHGLGNDFVVVDCLHEAFTLDPRAIQEMADRHTGIGFDQLLLIEPSHDNDVDFVYRVFNGTGEEVEQCGNGARCVAKYLYDQKLCSKNKISVMTKAGVLELRIEANGLITVNMGSPKFAPAEIPLLVPHQQLQYDLKLGDENIVFGAVSLGNPHAVIFVDDVQRAKVAELGSLMQQHPLFPQQVNVGFLQIKSRDVVKLRVFERGAGETLACGSGACAAMAIARKHNLVNEEIKVELPGGILQVCWLSETHPILLTGPVATSFRGEWL